KEPITDANGTKLVFRLEQTFGQQHVIGKFRLSVTTSKPPLSLTGPPANIAQILNTEPAKRTPQDQAPLAAVYKSTDVPLQLLQREVSRVQGELSALGSVPSKRQLGVQDLAWA